MTARKARQPSASSATSSSRKRASTGRIAEDPQVEELIRHLAAQMDPTVVVVPMGRVGDALPAFHALEPRFPLRYSRPASPPADAYLPDRKQYRARDFVAAVKAFAKPRALAITDRDIFDQNKNFVFGLAETSGQGAVISTARLKHDLKLIFYERVRKEAVHEIGHLYGLHHCWSIECVMYFSTDLRDTDNKGEWYCGRCSVLLKAMDYSTAAVQRPEPALEPSAGAEEGKTQRDN